MENKEKVLTEKQKAILLFIKEGVEKDGYQPSFRDIAEELKITVSAVRSHLLYTEKKGFIELTGKGRGIKFLREI